MALYVINVCGYETYEPVWFETDYSKTKFKRTVRECIDVVVRRRMQKGDGFINGHNVLDDLVPVLETIGFRKVVPDLEISLNGECYYQKGRHAKPQIFSRETWKQVVEYNQKLNYNYMAEFKKELAKKKKKGKKQ